MGCGDSWAGGGAWAAGTWAIWRCKGGVRGGIGWAPTGRLARNKSFFQKTLRSSRGAFLPRLARVDGRRQAARQGLGCGVKFRRMGGGEGHGGYGSLGELGGATEVRQGPFRGLHGTQWRLCRSAWLQTREGQKEQKEAQQESGEVRSERDDEHSSLGCRVYTDSVH